MQGILKRLITAAVLTGLIACARAEGVDEERTEFVSHCAACHGEDAKGNGPLSTKLKTKPADLTLLSKKNKGVFPVRSVYDAIDGRRLNDAHGIREMPIWGCRNTPAGVAATEFGKHRPGRVGPYESHLDLACDPEDVIANRILSVIEHLRRVQEK